MTITAKSTDPQATARAFKELYTVIETHPDIPVAEKSDLKAELEEVEEEITKGEEADEGFLARRLRNIGRMAPDILDVILSTFANPAVGLGLVARKVAKRVKVEAESTSP